MSKPSFLRTVLAPAAAVSLLFMACERPDTTGPSNTLATAAVTAPVHELGAMPLDVAAAALKKQSALAMGVLPASIDLSGNMPPIGDQGAQGSCVAWAAAYAAKTMLEKADRNWDQNLAQNQFSPAWLYNQIKSGSSCHSGSSLWTALSYLKLKGADNLAAFPYNPASCSTQPDAASINRALPFAIKEWYYLGNNQNDIKAVLAAGKPVVCQFSVLPDYDNLDNSGNLVYDDASGTSRGLHANAIVGYDDARGAFKLANSWGKSIWGQAGFGWIAYSMLGDSRVQFDALYFDNQAVSTSDHSIYRWGAGKWDQAANGGGVQIASDGGGIPWIVNKNHEVWRKRDATLSSGFDKMGTQTATDIGVGANGVAWITGTTRITGTNDFPVYRWNPATGAWDKNSSGGGVRITVDPAGNPYLVNAKGEVWKKDNINITFAKLPGQAVDIAIGKNGILWKLDYTVIQGTRDYPVYRWNAGTNTWEKATSGGGVRISVDANGVPYVINSTGEIWKKNDATIGSGFTKLSGLGTDIGAGSSVWITGTNIL
jgi:C1A family cysteine protease